MLFFKKDQNKIY